MMEAHDHHLRRPLGLNLLAGLYLFFFLVSASTFGNAFPFLGLIYDGMPAQILVFGDSLICLYLFIGIIKRQVLTWYLLLAYNLFEVVNTIINLNFIAGKQLEKIVGAHIHQETLMTNNIAAALAILLLSQFIYRHKYYFTNRAKLLF